MFDKKKKLASLAFCMQEILPVLTFLSGGKFVATNVEFFSLLSKYKIVGSKTDENLKFFCNSKITLFVKYFSAHMWFFVFNASRIAKLMKFLFFFI